ncbi:hypothetical protein fh0823_06970 [Francisella halioticida]|nr:trehalase family glycosidase [Francisella halioticida]BCD90558.1 hypothetical protein fh0823_06970 [Francisella halioticida]
MSNNSLIQLSGELFEAVQLKPCFNDSKYFVDMSPKNTPNEILKNYNYLKNSENFNLKSFIENNFYPPISEKIFDNGVKVSLSQYIKQMWHFLHQSSDQQNSLSSLISLPKPYIIPGGRFREVYYWDCYFTCEGLRVNGEIQMIKYIGRQLCIPYRNYWVCTKCKQKILSNSLPTTFILSNCKYFI